MGMTKHVALGDTTEFSGEQLAVLKEDVLVENDMFTDYTDEDGEVSLVYIYLKTQDVGIFLLRVGMQMRPGKIPGR